MANGAALYLQAVHSCGSPELQAANLPSANKRSSLQRSYERAFLGALGADSVNLFLPSAINFPPVGSDPGSSLHFCSTFSTVFLRI
jgi:hypothetical protein